MIPVNYRLEFEPDLDAARFGGDEWITADLPDPTDTLTLDAADLDIDSCDVTLGGESVKALVSLDPKSESISAKLPRKIEGRCTIHIRFSGALNDRLLGFYRSSYDGGRLATTQFEAADARRAFPCLDRPGAKATFDITITCGRDLEAVSNMPCVSKRIEGEKSTYRFARTPVMSTYLVYLGVGDFEHVQGAAGKTAVRVLATKGKAHRASYALDVACRLLTAYEEYFGIPYPLPKLDLIAVPDFAAGAMENWGAITFREPLLLYDADDSSARTRQLVTEVISHEIAHQWFGNLVTMEWWNDLWLNESFATLMATKFVDMIYPEFDMRNQFHGDVVETAMEADALASTHPIDARVESPAQIREIFDAISYDKGASVLMMLEGYVGERAFRDGLKSYLESHRYGNARGDDLWDAIGASSGLPVKDMMHTWIRNPGFPVLEAGVADHRVSLRQARFRYEEGGVDGTAWHIPVSTSSGGRVLMTGPAETLEHSDGSDVMVNPLRSGFYRVSYGDLRQYGRILGNAGLTRVDRLAVQNDLFAMCVAGRADIRRYMEIVPGYAHDQYPALTDVVRNVSAVRDAVYPEGMAYDVWDDIVSFLKAVLARLEWSPRPGERHTDTLLRGLVITSLGSAEDIDAFISSAILFCRFANGWGPLSPDVREAVCSVVSRGGGAAAGDALVSLYRKAGSQEETHRILRAMGHSASRDVLAGRLDFALTGEVRSQDTHILIASVAANPNSRGIFWPWLSSHWPAVTSKIGSGNPLLSRVVSGMSPAVDPALEGEIREFFAENPEPGTERALEQALERARIRRNLTYSIRESYGMTADAGGHAGRVAELEKAGRALLAADSPEALEETARDLGRAGVSASGGAGA